MIKGIRWYILRLFFSDFARGPSETLEAHILGLVKRYNLVAATVLKENYHYNMFGHQASTQLFGARPGTKPIIMELFISEVKIDSFIAELEELALKGKSNILYYRHEIDAIIGNPSVLDNIDEYKK